MGQGDPTAPGWGIHMPWPCCPHPQVTVALAMVSPSPDHGVPIPCPQAAVALPKHLLWFVARSTKTLAEMTLPKGRNICRISVSANSWGRW